RPPPRKNTHTGRQGRQWRRAVGGCGRSATEPNPESKAARIAVSSAARTRAWNRFARCVRQRPGRPDRAQRPRGFRPSATRAPVAARAPAVSPEQDDIEQIPVIGLRRKIAQKMQESKRHIPHFAYVEEVDVTELEKLRAYLNETRREDQPKPTLLPFIMPAVVRAVGDLPQSNARFDDDAGIITRYRAVHLGIATQTKSGLVVPVVKHAEALDI